MKKSQRVCLKFIQRWIWLTFFVSGIFLTDVQAQSYQVHTYNENDGLLNSMVYDLVQDRLGRMWFATRGGISVYNGAEWISYPIQNGLLQNSISTIEIDIRGTVWALPSQTSSRIFFFQDNRWQVLPLPSDIGVTGRLTSLAVLSGDLETQIAVGTEYGGLLLYQTDKWIQLKEQDGLLDNHVNAVETQGTHFIVATNSGLSVVLEGQIDKTQTNNFKFPTNEILGIYVDTSDNFDFKIWMIGKTWIGYLDGNKFSTVREDLNLIVKMLYSYLRLCPDGRGGLFYGNPFDFYHYNAFSGMIKRLTNDTGLITEGATSLFIDREKNLWVGSLRGVSKIVNMRFANFNKKHGLLLNEVSAVTEWKPGQLVFGQNNGLSFYENGQIQTLLLDPERSIEESETRILEMTTDSRGNLWAAVSSLGLLRISKDGLQKWFLQKQDEEYQIRSVLEDEDGIIWTAGNEGLYSFEAGRFNFFNPTEIKTGIRRIQQGPNNSLFLAMYGSGVIHLEDGIIKTYSTDLTSANSVYTVFPDTKGNTWVGTLDGLYFIENNSLVKYSLEGFEIGRPVYLILEDRKGRLWFGTDNGVIRWDGREKTVFTTLQGFGGLEINRGAGFVDSSGNWLPVIARVTSHIPDKGQVMIRYYGLYANAHRGKINKAGVSRSHPLIIEEEERFVDKIIAHLKLTFMAERPPPPQSVQQELLMAAEERRDYF